MNMTTESSSASHVGIHGKASIILSKMFCYDLKFSNLIHLIVFL